MVQKINAAAIKYNPFSLLNNKNIAAIIYGNVESWFKIIILTAAFLYCLSVFLIMETLIKKDVLQQKRPNSNTSTPHTKSVCFGINNTIEITITMDIKMSDNNARRGNCEKESMRVRLIEIPTNIKPVSAADAPTIATKKSCHSFIA